ncbi:MAG: HEAT repeat domain-containing protein [Candidatus Helarchaeota archaeon]
MSINELSSLIGQLKNKDARLRQIAAKKLGELRDPAAVKPLIDALDDKNKFVRESVVESLGIIGDRSSLNKLIPLLKDKYEGVRWIISYALAQFDDEHIVKPLVKALKDKQWSVRFFAAKSLGKIGDNRALYPLIRALKDKKPEVRYIAADSLGILRDRRAVDPLIETLNDKDPKVRSSAVYSLGRLGYIKAVEPLIKMLKDENSDVRYYAAVALGRLGDKRAIKPLMEALNDEKKEVRVAVIKNIVKFLNLKVLYALYVALRDENKEIRDFVAKFIINVKNSEVIDQIESSFMKRDRLDRTKLLQINLEISFFWFNKAFAFGQLRNYSKSAEFYKKVLQIDPQNIETWIALGIMHFHLRDFEKTLECFEKSRELGYKTKQIEELIGNLKNLIYEKIPSKIKIKEIGKKLEELTYPITSFWYKMGDNALKSKDFDDAIKYFENSVQSDPLNVNSWIKLGITYIELKKAKEAFECLEKALEIDSKNVYAWYYKAVVYGVLLRNNLESMHCVRRILEFDPENKLALSTLLSIQQKFENIFIDVFGAAEITIDEKKERIILESKEIKEELDKINTVKDELKRLTTVYHFQKINKIADNVRSIQSILKTKDEIKIKDLASKFETSISSMETWLMELMDDGIIKGEISGSKFIPLKEVDYEQLDEFHFVTEDQCAICHEPLESQEIIQCRNCNANFHKYCILKYIEEHKRCPVCSSIFHWV